MDLLRARKYGLLLAALGTLIVLHPLLRTTESDGLYDVLTTLVFGTALLLLLERRRARVAAVVLGLPTLVGIWLHDRLPGLPAGPTSAAFHAQAGVFLGFAVAVVLRRLYVESRVTADSLCGAFCGYILLGLAFGHAASSIELLHPGAFRIQGTPVAAATDADQVHFVLAYFSFVTLTTIGYGDVVPVGSAARSLVVIEGIAGQFYLAVLVAELLARKASFLLAPQGPDEGRPGSDDDGSQRSDG